MKFFNWLILLTAISVSMSCERTRIVEVNLPPSQTQTSVECYLEPGQPIKLALAETQDTYQKQTLPEDFYAGAFITITHSGTIDTLTFNLQQDTINSFGKIYNYSSPQIINYNEGEVFSLYIKTSKGKVITGYTSFINKVHIDSIYAPFNNRDKVNLKIDFNDNQATRDYYRITIAHDTIGLQQRAQLLFSDELFQTSKVSINPSNDFSDEDSLQVLLYHLDKPYYDFVRSVNDAIQANGNPFAVPSQIKSNITGGVGIFQALTYDRKKVAINK